MAGPNEMVWLLALSIVIPVLLFVLIWLVEAVALQLMRWGDFKRSSKASFWMNLASTVLGLFFLQAVLVLSFQNILIAWALSVIIDVAVLMSLKRGKFRSNMIAAIVANLASLCLLIIPIALLIN